MHKIVCVRFLPLCVAVVLAVQGCSDPGDEDQLPAHPDAAAEVASRSPDDGALDRSLADGSDGPEAAAEAGPAPTGVDAGGDRPIAGDLDAGAGGDASPDFGDGAVAVIDGPAPPADLATMLPGDAEFADTRVPSVPSRLIVSNQSLWRYFDLGREPDGAWWALDYNDAGWPSGPGRLGWQDGAITQVRFVVGFPDYVVSYYFRCTFDVQQPAAYQQLLLRLLRDDGAVVYINGVEVARSNMPDGPLVYDTFALAAVSATEEYMWFEFVVPGAVLRPGKNVVAARVHQNGVLSVDLGFDLELERFNP